MYMILPEIVNSDSCDVTLVFFHLKKDFAYWPSLPPDRKKMFSSHEMGITPLPPLKSCLVSQTTTTL